MNYGQVRDSVLKLLNQYSVAGSLVASSYNNQQDYLNRIPNLVNDAMTEIATTAKKIPVVIRLDYLPCEDLGTMLQYELPQDFYQFKSGGTILRTEDGKVLHTSQFTQLGKKYLLVPKSEKGEYLVTYYRYPELLGSSPADTDELDNDQETHNAIPYYVAAFIIDDDNAFQTSLFYNKFEDLLSKMSPGVTAEVHPVTDVYSVGQGDFYRFI